MRRALLFLAVTALALAGGAFAVLHGDWLKPPIQKASAPEDLYSHEAFQKWLAEDAAHREDFDRFGAFLARNRVDDAVPAWQLLRTEPHIRPQCERPAFLMPPEDQWEAIVPVLRVVRDEIEPLVGPVEVESAFRGQALNACIKGASRSRHLAFAAVDLIALDQPDNRALFETLCRFHRDRGPRLSLGLGAYFDPEEADKNRRGRFHIDVSGYRTWGSSYHSGSSGCRYLD